MVQRQIVSTMIFAGFLIAMRDNKLMRLKIQQCMQLGSGMLCSRQALLYSASATVACMQLGKGMLCSRQRFS